jgi:hypothetical protein
MNTSLPSPKRPESATNDVSPNAGNEQGKEVEVLREILKGADVPSLLTQRAAVIHKIRQALDLLEEAENTAGQAHLGFPNLATKGRYAHNGYAITLSGQYADRATTEAAIVKAVDMAAWEFLMDESGLGAFMDRIAREKWQETLYSGDSPELTLPAVAEVFGRLHAERNAMLEQSVIACFRSLLWDHNANFPRQFGEKVIVHYLTDDSGLPQSHATDTVDDLERVFHVLDGKPESVQRGSVHSTIYSARSKGTVEAETAYIRLRWYQNGNGHIAFKRHDLIGKMNAIAIARYPNALPATAGKRTKR